MHRNRRGQGFAAFLALLVISHSTLPAYAAEAAAAAPSASGQYAATVEAESPTFAIRHFEVRGSTLLPATAPPDEEMPVTRPNLTDLLDEFMGEGKSVRDLEAARMKLEKAYHELGYPTVMVNIPEQTVSEEGKVVLDVVEGKVRRVRVTGNHYFTMATILKDLPTLQEGSLIYLPRLQEELAVVNTHPDMKVEPTLTPGKDFGTVDVELKVEDTSPLHGSLELNNRASDNTHALRVNGILRYDNLWQRGHSLSGQFQTSPQDTNEVQVLSASYVLPPPWQDEHRLALYGIWSDSQTAFGEGFTVIGSGTIAGLRYIMPLTPYEQYSHNLTLGLDYKDFKETVGFSGDPAMHTPMQYWPLSVAYSASLPDSGGLTVFSAALNMSLRDLAADPEQFAIKRYRARGGYLYGTFGVERRQKLPWKTGLYLKLDGQAASEPLIANEQYVAGGMQNMRGYRESSEAADNALHFVSELNGPDFWEALGLTCTGKAESFLFYEAAHLMVQSPLESQDGSFTLSDAGVGLRGNLAGNYSYEMDWATVLSSRPSAKAGDQRLFFSVKYAF